MPRRKLGLKRKHTKKADFRTRAEKDYAPPPNPVHLHRTPDMLPTVTSLLFCPGKSGREAFVKETLFARVGKGSLEQEKRYQ